MPHRILLADDSLTIQKVVELTFSGTEFELKAVGNGDLALPLLESFSPDIVLADAVMPGKTGYEVCEEVKRRPGGRFLPVVLLTGTFEPFDKPRAERSGADAVVTKPFDSQGLATLVRELVAKAAQEKAAAPPEPPPAPEPPPPPPPAEERAESTDPTLAGQTAFQTVPMNAMSRAAAPVFEPLPEENLYATSAIPIFREPEAVPPPMDPPTEPIAFATELPAPEAPAPGYEMDMGSLDEQPTTRDLEEDIARFEASGKGTTRPELWDSPAVKAAESSSSTAGEQESGDLEALAAEASLTDLKSLIPQSSASAATAGPLSDADIERVARRVLELSGERIVRKIAWDVVPELAERLVKERLEEIDRTD